MSPQLPDTAVAEPAEFTPEWTIPPGEIIQSELNARGLTQAEFALRTSLSAKHVNQLIKGIVNLSPDVAMALERTLGIRAEFWLKTEATWRATRTRMNSRANLSQFSGWLAKFPTQSLIANRIVDRADDTETRIDRLLRFFGVTDTTAFDKVWLQPQANFKRSQQFSVDPYATALWIRLVEAKAEAIAGKTPAYDPKKLQQVANTIPRLTKKAMPEAFIAVRDLLSEAGVILVFMPELTNTRICGASRWLSTGQPVVGLTNRNKRLDSFWFYLAHEIGHILLHPGRATFVDLYDKSVKDNKDDQETDADNFALQLFVPEDAKARLAQISVSELVDFATELDIAVDIAAGQHAYIHNSWSAVSKFRRSVELDAILPNI
ncbi:helix-turn-helix domain-containing protein [Nocardia goodfellowii]